MKPTIRIAKSKDFDSLVSLFRQTEKMHAKECPEIFTTATSDDVKKAFQKFFADEDIVNLILETDGKIRGYLRYRVGRFPNVSFIARKGEKRCYIEEIVVDESSRRLGFGRSLLQHLEQQMKKEGVPFIHLHVFAFNENAAKLYKSLGFSPITMELGKTL